MKNKAIKYISILLVSCMIFMLSACGQQTAEFDPNSDYDSIVEQAKGQTVTFYGWGGNEANNRWIDTVLAPAVEEKYGITLKRVPMDIEQVMAKLVGEKQAGKQDGSIDMIWINGENFYSAKENDLLFCRIFPSMWTPKPITSGSITATPPTVTNRPTATTRWCSSQTALKYPKRPKTPPNF